MTDDIDRNCISYWFPKLRDTGVAVPRTEFVRWQGPGNLCALLDGECPEGFAAFVAELRTAGERMGYPCFLRTGHVSGKHEWRKTCYVTKPEDFPQHVAMIVEASEMTGTMGLPSDVWAVRHFLRLQTAFTAFRGMPVARERRCFIRDGKVECVHPYWPEKAIARRAHEAPLPANWRHLLDWINTDTRAEREHVERIAAKVGRSFDDYWSVDCARSVGRTWYVLDMALGDESYHWPMCSLAPAEDKA